MEEQQVFSVKDELHQKFVFDPTVTISLVTSPILQLKRQKNKRLLKLWRAAFLDAQWGTKLACFKFLGMDTLPWEKNHWHIPTFSYIDRSSDG